MTGRVLVACAAVLLAATPALGQKRPELDGPSQRDMSEQAAARYRMADAELNEVYNKLLATASPSGRERLRAAQRAWIAFRDLDCEARAGSRGGSFHAAAMALCLEHLADRRRGALQAELNCAEGDMSCGGVTED